MMPNKSVVPITGASTGIGKETATLLAQQGFQVFGTGRKPLRKNEGGVQMLPLDVTSDQSVSACVSAVIEQAGRIDVLVNNAGIGLLGALEETSLEEAGEVFETNFFGMARMVNAVLPGMRQRRQGLIVNLGSASRDVADPLSWLPQRLQGGGKCLYRCVAPGSAAPGHPGRARRARHGADASG